MRSKENHGVEPGLARDVEDLDHKIIEKLKGLENQARSQHSRDKRDWSEFRRDIKDLINYELSNVKKNEASMKIQSISEKMYGLAERFGADIENESFKKSSKEASENIIEDLNTLKNPETESGFIVSAEQYNTVAGKLFDPVKELLDDTGRAKFKLDADEFHQEIVNLEKMTDKIPSKLPHTTRAQEEEEYVWVEEALPEGVDAEADKLKTNVKYENEVRMVRKRKRKVTPELLESVENSIEDIENEEKSVAEKIQAVFASDEVRSKLAKILDGYQKIYEEANIDSGDLIQDMNIPTKLKQGYYLHKLHFSRVKSDPARRRMLARKYLHKRGAFKLLRHMSKAMRSTGLDRRDRDMVRYMRRRLQVSMRSDFKNRALAKALNSLVGAKLDRVLDQSNLRYRRFLNRERK